jgi:hypothetical protein
MTLNPANMDITDVKDGLMSIDKEIKEGVYEDYFEAKTKHEQLEDYRKVILASCELKYEGSQAEIARRGLADEDYKDYLKGLREARKQMNHAYAKVKGLEARLDIFRSLNRHFHNI